KLEEAISLTDPHPHATINYTVSVRPVGQAPVVPGATDTAQLVVSVPATKRGWYYSFLASSVSAAGFTDLAIASVVALNPEAAVAFATLGAVGLEWSKVSYIQAVDPPDPDYTRVATPVIR